MTSSTLQRQISDYQTLSPEALNSIRGRAVRSARSCIELLCRSEIIPSVMHRVAWDTQRFQEHLTADHDLHLYEQLDLQDAVQCLDFLGLLKYPFPDRLQVIEFSPEVVTYELKPDGYALFNKVRNDLPH